MIYKLLKYIEKVVVFLCKSQIYIKSLILATSTGRILFKFETYTYIATTLNLNIIYLVEGRNIAITEAA